MREMPTRAALEAGLIVLTSLRVALALASLGCERLAVWLLVLTIYAVISEGVCGGRTDLRERSRMADSEGVALGAVTLPWLTSAIHLSQCRQGTDSVATPVYATLACSATILFSMHSPAPPEERVVPESPAAKTKGSTISGRRAFWLSMLMQACGFALTAGVLIEQVIASRYAISPSLGSLLMAVIVPGISWGLLQALPMCFTLGESILVAQALALLGGRLTHIIPEVALQATELLASAPVEEHALLVVQYVIAVALLAAVSAGRSMLCLGNTALTTGRQHVAITTGTALATALLSLWPAVWAVRFAVSSKRRILLVGYWGVLLSVAVPLIVRASRVPSIPKIIVRKLYHLLAAAIFLPGLLFDGALLAVSSAAAFAVLVALELLRIGRIPPLGEALQGFMSQFADVRDSGVLLVSHFSLLLGMAAPVWMSLSTTQGHAGLLCECGNAAGFLALGVLDAAASVVGTTLGRVPVHPGAKKTVEGLLGGIAFTLAIGALLPCFHTDGTHDRATIFGAVTAIVGTGLLEAFTTQMDNIFLPLYLYLMLLLPCN